MISSIHSTIDLKVAPLCGSLALNFAIFEWAKEVWNGKPLMSAEEALKFYAVNGRDIVNDVASNSWSKLKGILFAS